MINEDEMAENMNQEVENPDEKKDQKEEVVAEEELQASETESEEGKEQGSNEEDYKSKYFYLAAEMDNMRKRFEREKDNLLKYGNEKILSGLVEVVDNLERTTAALKDETDEKIKNIVTGVEMVRKQFLDVLHQNGLEEVEAEGKIFDPKFHEAMAQQPAEDKKENEVIQTYQKGYILNGRLLRPAKVIVAKKPE